jgi:hypothetical protein
MIKKCILIISMMVMIASSHLKAQSFAPDVIGSAGTYVSTASGSMSWTIGEAITETGSSVNNFFTQGFQQPDSLIVTGILPVNETKISVYPNPVVNNLIVSLPASSGNYSVEVYDMQGQLLQRENIESSTGQSFDISFAGLSNGIYLVNIIHAETHLMNSYKINKVN